jgi:hypothetical protein
MRIITNSADERDLVTETRQADRHIEFCARHSPAELRRGRQRFTRRGDKDDQCLPERHDVGSASANRHGQGRCGACHCLAPSSFLSKMRVSEPGQ